ncbi:hypothetical protein PBAL39_16546 [Pedobacter sp. BAL39]|uniref:SMI1/KNR4 family protein n=1 Tax=Pedobacter sp. BAL39 TaxID=391596 RepID=UPI0001559F7E|nr:SMI1/KNR4 family protein [Pedobacter sp. BAL39]EDM35109.1 hypothetical protein PBAL39_16546 [Pedobacter sp. BAL39]
MEEIIALVWQHGFSDEDREALENFKSRDGFELISDQDLKGMLAFFKQYPDDFEDLIPIMTDNNSNYICVYFQGQHFGKVCYLSHDEMDLTPFFSSIRVLVEVINRYPEAWDFPEIPADAYDISTK